jgi:hypothetical protein
MARVPGRSSPRLHGAASLNGRFAEGRLAGFEDARAAAQPTIGARCTLVGT